VGGLGDSTGDAGLGAFVTGAAGFGAEGVGACGGAIGLRTAPTGGKLTCGCAG
jgi:hypothetical protein